MLNKQPKIILGGRASLLSVSQAKSVIKLLKKKYPRRRFVLRKITTLGDKIKRWKRLEKGIFVKEIEEALLEGKIDIAVHSVKDMPTVIPKGLKLEAVIKRDDPRDVLVVRQRIGIFNLRKKSIVGTSSLRRAAQLLRWRPDLRIKNLRGNLDTRIRKLYHREFDAIVVAAAGIKRLGFKNLLLKYIPEKIMVPAAGQGAIGLEIKKGDKFIKGIVKKINNPEAFFCISCERAFLKEIGAGCRLPLGALAKIKNNKIHLDAAVISLDGKKMIRLNQEAPLKDAKNLGRRLAKAILKKGANEILKNVRKNR